MNGPTIIGAAVLQKPTAGWQIKSAGDFNGDGHADILWQNTDGTPAIWEMNGTTIIGAAVLQKPTAGLQVVGTSDFNGDGHADIVWQNTDGTPAIWEMNGTTIIGAGVLPNQGASWQVKDDGPIPADQMTPASGNAAPALHLSTPDLFAGGIAPAGGDTASSWNFRPPSGTPTFRT